MDQFIQRARHVPRKLMAHKRLVATSALAVIMITALIAATSTSTATTTSSKTMLQKPTTTAAADELSTAFRNVSNEVLPSVVTIESHPAPEAAPEAKSQGGNEVNPQQPVNPFEGTPFGDLFRDNPFGKGFRFEMPPGTPHHRGGGSGSGVIIDPSGLILTNNHVVDGGGKVTVRLQDGREYDAAQVLTDPKSDLALVRIKGASGLTAAKLGDSDKVEVGDWVLALGQPFGLESTVTAGIISAKHRGIGIAARENFLQTDAAINPGNSGGPLVNLQGQVIGINTAISSRGGGNDGIGFAIPANMARWVTNQLESGGVVRRAYLGVGIQPMNARLAEQFHVQPREGVVVTQVMPDTPAAAAGLKTGDVIVAFAGTPITNAGELQTEVERAPIGSSQELTVIRNDKRMTLTLKPQEAPNDELAVQSNESSASPSSHIDELGIEVGELKADVARQLGVEGAKGVVITNVRPDSAADQAGLESGNVITQVNGKDVTNVEEVRKALDAAGNDKSKSNSVLLLIRTANGSRFVVVG